MIELNTATLHCEIIRTLLATGRAPSVAALAQHFSVDSATVKAALSALQDLHGVVLHPHTSEVWVAHPFSTAPTPFAVKHGSRCWWGNCAWCSLGVAALLGGNGVVIHTSLGAEGQAVAIHIDDGMVRENLWVHFPIPMAQAWDNVLYTCSTMLVFDSESAIDSWCTRHAIPRGDAQPIQQAYDFAAVWYGRHLDLDWRKWTLEEARSIFASFHFRGPVWALPDADGHF